MTTKLTHEQIIALIDIEVFKTPARDIESRKKRMGEGEKLKAEYTKGTFTKTDAVKAIIDEGGSMDAKQMNKLLGITTEKRTTATESNTELEAMRRELAQTKAALEASQALNQLVPVIATPKNQTDILNQIKQDEATKAALDIATYTTQREQEAENKVFKRMRLVYPDWDGISSDEHKQDVKKSGLNFKGLDEKQQKQCLRQGKDQAQVDAYKLKVWQGKVEQIVDEVLRNEVKTAIGDDYSSNWEMIYKFYKEMVKNSQ